MKYKYWVVYEYYPDEDKDGNYFDTKRRIYTFDNQISAHNLVEFLYQNDFQEVSVGVEEEELPYEKP